MVVAGKNVGRRTCKRREGARSDGRLDARCIEPDAPGGGLSRRMGNQDEQSEGDGEPAFHSVPSVSPAAGVGGFDSLVRRCWVRARRNSAQTASAPARRLTNGSQSV